MSDDALPATLGRFTIRARLGQGGMGRVYLAHDPELARDVAIKVLRPETADSEIEQKRLVREAQAMAKLAHPHVIAVYEVGRAGDDVFVVMEHVAGGTLATWLAQPRSWRAIATVIAQIAEGLAAAHAAGLVHRDVKPDNILIGADGRARITDFGLVGRTVIPEAGGPGDPHEPASTDARLTHAGTRLGTLGYMAPEQLAGDPATAASDQFGLCVTLYEAVYGERPHAGTTYRELALAVTRGELRAARADRAVPITLDAIARRGLAVSPADRWPDLAALAAALRALVPDTEIPAALPAPASPLSQIVPSRAPFAAIGALAIGGAFVAIAATRGADDPPQPPPPPTKPSRARLPNDRVAIAPPGCARTPAFVDDDHLLYAQVDGDAGDLYIRDLALNTDRRLTNTPTTSELNPQLSIGDRSVVFLAQDRNTPGFAAQRLALDGATAPVQYPLPALAMSAGAVLVRDDLYYVVGDGSTLARLRGSTSSEIVKLPGKFIFTVAPSPNGRYLAINASGMCVVDLAKLGEPACVTPAEASYGRYLVGDDGDTMYYGAPTGIRSIVRSTNTDALVVADAGINGGMALSPSGHRIAWSECQPQIALTQLAATGGPPARIVHTESLTGPSSNRRDEWTFVRESATSSILVFLDGSGIVHELTTKDMLPGVQMLEPDGERIVFGRADKAGLYLAWGARQKPIEQLTDNVTDTAPVWLADDRVAYTRLSAANHPEVWILDTLHRDPPKRAFDRPRITVDRAIDRSIVLLMSDDRTRLFLWNFATGVETEVPQPAEFHRAQIIEAELSPDAKHITIQRGLEVWRFAVAGGSADRLWAPPIGHGIYGLEVDHADHVVVGDSHDGGGLIVAELP